MTQPNNMDAIGWQQQIHMKPNQTWFVADLPGHDGIKPVAGSKSDWGWTTDRAKAIALTPYWQRRFKTFCESDTKRPWKLEPIAEHETFTAQAATMLTSFQRQAREIEAERCTLELATASKKRIDSGRQCIEDSPLFGGSRQETLF